MNNFQSQIQRERYYPDAFILTHLQLVLRGPLGWILTTGTINHRAWYA